VKLAGLVVDVRDGTPRLVVVHKLPGSAGAIFECVWSWQRGPAVSG
jgi:hypothetical protein